MVFPLPVFFLRSVRMPLYRVSGRLLALCLVCLVCLAGCGGNRSLLSPLDRAFSNDTIQNEVNELLAKDPKGPIPSPQLPPELAGAVRPSTGAASVSSPVQTGGQQTQQADPLVVYEVVCLSPEVPELAERFLESSTLVRRQDTPLYSTVGLEQRLSASLGEASEMLHSLGFYSGRASGSIKPVPGETTANTIAMLVTVNFRPGPQYLVGSTPVVVEQGNKSASAPEKPGAKPPAAPLPAPNDHHLPKTLEDVGLLPEAPARADDVLEAVARVRTAYRNNGYPEATIALSRFFLDHETRRLDASIHILPGPFMRMGPLEVPGETSVTKEFLRAKKTWEIGEPWHEGRVEQYREALRQTGLFSRVDVDPAEKEDASANRPVVLATQASPERTVGAAVKYDTSFGPGFQGSWEHRNFTGRGDSLRLEMPLWQDMQELSARYRLPYFLRDDQDFLLQGAVLNQHTDAFDLEAARVASGVDRRLSRNWSLSVLGSAEGGALTDPGESREAYQMYGVPVTLGFDSTNSLLDATRGGRASFMLAPYVGAYGEPFTVLRSRVDAQRFIPFTLDESLVLALRGTVGWLYGADASDVPPSARFYSGGGGSVRGYEFQSIGPRNVNKDPMGGSSLVEWSVEPRWRFSETWGLVAFVDGGMVYDDFDQMSREMQYGAGFGLRFFTAIGPMRFDVATPLNPREDDDFLQFYISIGQSF